MREHKSAHKDLQTFVEKVLALHEDVRFAALFDWEGRRLAGGMKRGIPSLDPPKKSSQIDRASALYPVLLASNKRYFGRFEFMFARMEKVHAVVVQVGSNRMLVVTTNPPTGLNLIPAIERVIRQSF
ncbi:MAG: hypothetical protein E6K90_08890 [Thaumarchaeota archaeon]|nr:MAG: hypothetical protein E6K90_08890 [Nitrososphaerota archaeon]